ncbi:hypothetical protein [Nitrospirillum sp. BR 11828]|uniref:hypothetical protein n=1 Tax=Nitrospirillum sp. BR 11828 TaxID=3104325 RepID=UPI002ACA3AB3|nr:hypothetical protein [Nitrospirillum sp. BR 11828]MDZ5647161.1 hypothetical protein [Nitrospirillum sp. BR 11828]
MEQTFKPFFDLVRRMPGWAEIGILLILGILPVAAHNVWLMLPALVWVGIIQGAEEKWSWMWVCFASVLLMLVILAWGQAVVGG